MIELCLCLVLRGNNGLANAENFRTSGVGIGSDSTRSAEIPRSRYGEVLLGKKRRGFGKGNLVGPGGHIEVGESPREAAVREVAEEVGLTIVEADLEAAGEFAFQFPRSPHLDARVWVFRAQRWNGWPRESDELAPAWYSAVNPPIDDMWDDNRFWLARVLAGEYVRANFRYSDDDVTVASVEYLRGNHD